MRYTVRVFTDRIVDVLNTDDLSEAINMENHYANLCGADKVWMADAVMEILVG